VILVIKGSTRAELRASLPQVQIVASHPNDRVHVGIVQGGDRLSAGRPLSSR
jgi:hypothetical protein